MKSNKHEKIIEQAYSDYADKIYRYSLGKLSRKEDAEEVLSESFKRLLEQDDLEKIENLQAWIFGIARNVIYEKYRQKKFYTYSDYEDYDVSQVSGISEDIENKLAKKEVVDLIKENLEELDDEAQEILRLKVWEELKFKEIAEVTNQKENSVKTIYYRALKKLNSSVNIDLSRKAVVVDSVVILSGLRVLASSKYFSLDKSVLEELFSGVLNGTGSVSVISKLFDKLKKFSMALINLLFDLKTIKVAAGIVGAGGLAFLGLKSGIVAPEAILNIGKVGCNYKEQFYEVGETLVDEEECKTCSCTDEGIKCDDFQCIERSYSSISSSQKYNQQISITSQDSDQFSPLIALSENRTGQQVYLYDLEGNLQKSFTASTKGSGIDTVITDIDDDGYNEIITSKTDGDNNISLWAHSAKLENTFGVGDSSGFMIDSCDFDGDGVEDELVLGKQNKGQVVIFNSQGEYLNYFSSFIENGGVSVVCGDLDDDKKDEIIIGQLQGDQKIGIYKPDGSLVKAFNAFIKGEGVLVSTGNLDEDKNLEILVSKLSGGNEIIKFDSDGSVINYFKPYPDDESDGVNVATIDLDKDGVDEIIVGKNFGGGEIGVFDSNWDLVANFEASNIIDGAQIASGWMDLDLVNSNMSNDIDANQSVEDQNNEGGDVQESSNEEKSNLDPSLKPVIWIVDPNSGEKILAVDEYGELITSISVNKSYEIGFSLFDRDGDQISEILMTSRSQNNGFEWLKDNGNSLGSFSIGTSAGYVSTTCDLDGDGKSEALLAGKSDDREVVIMDMNGNYQGYFTAFSSGIGVNIACGNLDQDSNDEILVSKKQGGREVLVYDSDLTLIRYFTAFTSGDGVFVSAGNVDSDSQDEIIASKLDGSYVAVYEADGNLNKSFKAFESGSGAVTDPFDFDKDGIDEIVVGKLSGGNEILIYKSNGTLYRVLRGISKANGSMIKVGWLNY